MDGPNSPSDEAWAPWHPRELSRRLENLSRPWCVVGGWALDLWHGRQTREHEDLEFTMLREDLRFYRCAFNELELHTVRDGIIKILPENEQLPADISQIWCLDAQSRCWRVDMMIEPGKQDVWVYKRHPALRRARSDMVSLSADRIPYLNPAAVLLFKAKHRRAKDQEDFERALPTLPLSERLWLRTCLDCLHPDHAWTSAL